MNDFPASLLSVFICVHLWLKMPFSVFSVSSVAPSLQVPITQAIGGNCRPITGSVR
jgi:hypothetical protein